MVEDSAFIPSRFYCMECFEENKMKNLKEYKMNEMALESVKKGEVTEKVMFGEIVTMSDDGRLSRWHPGKSVAGVCLNDCEIGETARFTNDDDAIMEALGREVL